MGGSPNSFGARALRLIGKRSHDLGCVEMLAGVRIFVAVVDQWTGIDGLHGFLKNVVHSLLQALVALVKSRRHLQANDSLAVLAFGPQRYRIFVKRELLRAVERGDLRICARGIHRCVERSELRLTKLLGDVASPVVSACVLVGTDSDVALTARDNQQHNADRSSQAANLPESAPMIAPPMIPVAIIGT